MSLLVATLSFGCYCLYSIQYHSVGTLYIGMARKKSHVIHVQKATKFAENDALGLNTLEIESLNRGSKASAATRAHSGRLLYVQQNERINNACSNNKTIYA